jgi:membrane protein implicated in regulation of membrane protease activity
MPGFSPLSPTTLASFVTAFGGFGLIFSKFPATANPWIHVPLSIFAGLVVAAGVFVIFNRIFRATQSSSEGRVAELMGQSATVITPIAPGGVGEIAYVQNGTRYTAPARSQDETRLPAGASVWIVRVEGAHFYVSSQ